MTEKEKKDESSLNKLKNSYNSLKSKYNLPEFKILNENFEIESLSGDETDILLKKIRKQLMEKVFFNIRTLETFLNPSNAPLFIFNIIKTFTEADKNLISGLYKQMSVYEVESFGLEAKYSEEGEAKLIKQVWSEWPKISEALDSLYKSIKANYNQESKKQSKSYFG